MQQQELELEIRPAVSSQHKKTQKHTQKKNKPKTTSRPSSASKLPPKNVPPIDRNVNSREKKKKSKKDVQSQTNQDEQPSKHVHIVENEKSRPPSPNRNSQIPLAYIFDENRDSYFKKPYHLLGDPSMYTPENLKIRNELKQNEAIRKCIEKFYSLYNKDENGNISKEEYLRVQTEIGKILHPKMSLEEIQELSIQDWTNDSKGSNVLDKENFFASIFELTDIWCRTVNAKEYCIFLDTLFIKMKYPDAMDPNAYAILG